MGQKDERPVHFPLPEEVLRTMRRFDAAGVEVYLVGGCVRDLLRGVTPHDYDMTTAALPDEVHRLFAGEKLIDTGIRHGTVTLLVGGMPLEITTYRIDGGYRDNRHPDAVTFATGLREDVIRRDFTMNAIAYHPARGIVDYTGGAADIAARCIRAVGEPGRRFREDALRVLRAFRFAATLDFSLDENTAAEARRHAPLLSSISRERVREEVEKLLCGVAAGRILQEEAASLTLAVPGLSLLPETPMLVDALPGDPLLRWAAFLFAFRGDRAEEAGAILDGLRSDRHTRDTVKKLLAHAEDPWQGGERDLRRLAANVGFPDAGRLLEMHLAMARTRQDETGARQAEEALLCLAGVQKAGVCCSLADLAVNGRDLLCAGIPEGKALGICLRRLLAAVLDGTVPNEREALLAFAETES